MKVCFYTIISDSHWAGCRTDEFIKSFHHFHSDIPLIIFDQQAIDHEFANREGLNFYNCKAAFAKKLYNKYDLVVNIDSDHAILGPLDSILKADYDVAAPANYNKLANASIKAPKGDLVSEKEFFQGGLIASTSKDFWNHYDAAAMRNSNKYQHSENDVLNVLLYNSNYKIKFLDGHGDFNHPDFHSFYGCASLGQEKDMRVENGEIKLNGKPVKAYHFSWGGINKKHPSQLFTKEVSDFIYEKIVL